MFFWWFCVPVTAEFPLGVTSQGFWRGVSRLLRVLRERTSTLGGSTELCKGFVVIKIIRYLFFRNLPRKGMVRLYMKRACIDQQNCKTWACCAACAFVTRFPSDQANFGSVFVLVSRVRLCALLTHIGTIELNYIKNATESHSFTVCEAVPGFCGSA